MSPAEERGGDTADGDATPSVLANLPRTRPQRATARRTAARSANGGAPETASPRKPARARKAQSGTAQRAAKSPKSATASKRSSTPAKRPTAAKPSRPRVRRAPAAQAVAEPVPRQGFETEAASASGSVPPPGGAEFIATAAEIVSEVARASLSTGERLLRDALSRLRH